MFGGQRVQRLDVLDARRRVIAVSVLRASFTLPAATSARPLLASSINSRYQVGQPGVAAVGPVADVVPVDKALVAAAGEPAAAVAGAQGA